MKNGMKEKEEHLERLWEMKEDGKTSIDELGKGMNGNYDAHVVEDLMV
jgi:hypothetical protein